MEPTTGYEHVATSDLPGVRLAILAELDEATDPKLRQQLYSDLEYLNAEIGKRV